ncbi:hypothetical protein MAL01_12185 [Leptospira noguchii]|uniref:hypothetical protein n=1 Tax=Leptospira noguchii TaxID=28182 RepID=UPI001FB6B735|nr:hypothetical protein [Leptospira noguchii]UOG44191.1 hypothetical protein MAL01_12185 [Leptospira noguchii]
METKAKHSLWVALETQHNAFLWVALETQHNAFLWGRVGNSAKHSLWVVLETQQNTPYGSCFRSLDRSRCGVKLLVFYEN